ncbi:hypothetical protein [Streptomyces sp. SLBN-115]|uniref:hypothetical protein n=1 Tax=Streptomyces sp. SLBN-115 TaxID=2768453 RepID=UPI001153215B|nr:hypothetical protein [Streptomyces sp. SLBN-115]TQJ54522.1 hypothetical protein FBY34_2299 [Streptomyces sp. SLBN-115]
MRLYRNLAAGAASLALFTTLSGCGSDSETKTGADSVFGSDGSGSSGDSGSANLPSAKTLRDVQEFISGAGLPCDNLTDDESAQGTPSEGFLGPSNDDDDATQKAEADAWKIGKSGFCGETRSDTGGWIIYLPSDMKGFQENYRKQAQEFAKEDGWTDKLARGRFLFGADFIVDPTNYQASKTLLEAGLLLENCDPSFKAPDGYRVQDAQASGCVLTNYLLDPLDQ